MTSPPHLLALAAALLGPLLAPAAATASTSAAVKVQFPGVQFPGGRSTPILGGQATFRILEATHESGIASAWVKVDGVLVSEVRQPCASDAESACDDILAPVDLSVDTRRFTGGMHAAAVGVTDGEGFETTASGRSILVDNDAPNAPVPQGTLNVVTRKPSYAISWRGPANEGMRGTTADITRCDASGCRAVPAVASAGRNANLAIADLPIGVTTVRIALRDSVGNFDPTHVTTWTITRAPVVRPSPRLTIAGAKVARDRRTVTVRGTVRSVTDGRVTVTLRAHTRGRVRTVKHVAPVVDGRFSAHVVARSSRWRRATVTVTTTGDRMIAPGRRTISVRQAS